MRRRDTYWSLYHKSEKRQIDDLKTDAIEVIFEILSAKDHGDWLVWREGFATWKPMTDFPDLMLSLRKGGMMNAPSQPAPAPSAAQRDVATRLAQPAPSGSSPAQTQSPSPASANAARLQVGPETKHDSKPVAKAETSVQDRLARQGSLDSTVDFDLMAETELGDRAARYSKKWQIRIQTEGKPLLFTSVDASNKGFSLKEALPRGLPQYFNVEVVANDMTIPLICSEISNKDGKPSTRLRIEVNHNPSLLQAALLQ